MQGGGTRRSFVRQAEGGRLREGVFVDFST
jgi:hypothetical protein